jgi:hypothetical protein
MQINETFKQRKLKVNERVKIWGGYDSAETLEREINNFIESNVSSLADIKFNVIEQELGEHHSACLIYTPIDG